MVIDIFKFDVHELKGQIVALDTNILYWVFYGASYGNHDFERYSLYSSFVEKLLSNDATLVTTSLNISELLHIVEKNEWNIYNYVSKGHEISFKRYRNNIFARNEFNTLCDNIYKQICSCVIIEDFNLRKQFLEKYIESINKYKLDSFDYALLELCKENSIEYILTDDSDFYSDDIGCKVLTVPKKNQL